MRKLIIERDGNDFFAYFESSEAHHRSAQKEREDRKSRQLDPVYLNHECDLRYVTLIDKWHMVIDVVEPKKKRKKK